MATSKKPKKKSSPPKAKLPSVPDVPVSDRVSALDDTDFSDEIPPTVTFDGANDSEPEPRISSVPPSRPRYPSVASSRATPAPEEDARDDSEPAPPLMSPAPSVEQVQAQIRKLEARLDRMIEKSARKGSSGGSHAERAARAIAERLNAPLPIERPGGDDGGVIDAARELLSSDYYLRQWGRIAMRNRSEEVDEFGLDPKYEARVRPLFDFLYKKYFRVEAHGVRNIPSEGRCLVVANHSGTFPYDGAMLKTAVRLAHPTQRELRWLAEDFVFYLPFIGAFMNRIGAVRACQENAERLLRQERLVAVFPEGVKGIGKLYRDRYRLQRFGRGGFIRLCLRTETPIVPCAVIGAEEANPMLYRLEYLANAVGFPYLPITPTFPALGPLGLVPAPTKWKVEFGEPIRFDGYGPEAADDSLLVGRLSDRVRASIQSMVDRGVSERQSVWFG
jgi:1-acyl-sn-glycerol-3-phosphate acyltransferase